MNKTYSVLEGRRNTSSALQKSRQGVYNEVKAVKGDTSSRDTSRAATAVTDTRKSMSGLTSGQSMKQSTINSNNSVVREPPQATSSQGVRMFTKDYSKSQQATVRGKSSGSTQPSRLRNSVASGNAIKSLESMLRKSTIKPVEPLKKRTGLNSTNSNPPEIMSRAVVPDTAIVSALSAEGLMLDKKLPPQPHPQPLYPQTESVLEVQSKRDKHCSSSLSQSASSQSVSTLAKLIKQASGSTLDRRTSDRVNAQIQPKIANERMQSQPSSRQPHLKT